MTQVVFDVTTFRGLFPAFASADDYSDTVIELYWDQATCYMSDQTNDILSEKCLILLVNYLTAHLLQAAVSVGNDATAGSGTGVVKSSTIDDVSITVATPDFGSDTFSWWINSTPYGKQFYALLSAKIAGGIYIGGSADISAFRGASGLFNA